MVVLGGVRFLMSEVPLYTREAALTGGGGAQAKLSCLKLRVVHLGRSTFHAIRGRGDSAVLSQTIQNNFQTHKQCSTPMAKYADVCAPRRGGVGEGWMKASSSLLSLQDLEGP